MQYLKFTFFCVSLFGLIFSAAPPGLAEEDYESEWPCVQRLVDNISLTAVWQGPSIEEFTATWWEDPTLIPLVNELLDETLNLELSLLTISHLLELEFIDVLQDLIPILDLDLLDLLEVTRAEGPLPVVGLGLVEVVA